jgi:Na+/proline symporter
MIFTLILFIAIIVLMLAIGYLAGRKQTSGGFLLYDRKLPKNGFIASYLATFIGAGFFITGTAYAYVYGIGFLWYLIGTIIGIFIFGFFSKWLKNYSNKSQSKFFNLPDFFQDRFGKVAGKAIALLGFTLLAGDIAVQFIAGGKLIQSLGLASYIYSIIITIIVIGIYLWFSGFRAVIWTDYVLAVLIGIITFILSYVSYQQIAVTGLTTFVKVPLMIIISFFLFGLFNPYGISTYYQRIFAAKDENTVKKGTWISGVILLIAISLILVIGLSARSLFPNIDPDLAFISLIFKFGGIILSLGAVLLWAALMSTADTMTFAASQILFRNVLNRELTIKNTRIGILVILLLGLLISIFLPSVVKVSILFLGGGMIIAPIVFFQWFTRFSEKAVVLAIIISVLAIVIFTLIMGLTPVIVMVALTSTISVLFITKGIEALFKRKTKSTMMHNN